jgi:hypothetical protein
MLGCTDSRNDFEERKMLKILMVIAAAAATLSGCVVTPPVAYAPTPVYYATPVVAAPMLGVGVRIR